jgi:glucose dehydrogenase
MAEMSCSGRRTTTRSRWLACCAALLGMAGVGCGTHHNSASAGWPHWGNTAENTHYAQLNQINASNVSQLRLAWKRPEGGTQTAWETFPVVIGQTMYYTTDTDEVLAVDARNGRQRWSYLPQVNFQASPQSQTAQPVSRGVTVGGGRVYELTYDEQLIALDAGTGRRLWHVRVANAAHGYTATSPGVYWHGEVIVGGPAGDARLRGYVAAYSAADGRRLWRTTMSPGSEPIDGSGGDVWMPPVVDPRSGTVYSSAGNPAPAFSQHGRGACAQWADATVALNARSGQLDWVHHELCGDAWDYDTTQSPMVLDVNAHGRAIRAVGAGSKAGFYSTLDARTGSLIARTPELVRYSQPHRTPTGSGTLVCPGIYGGLEYGPPSYSPSTGDLYLTTTDSCMRYTLRGVAEALDGGASGLNGTATPVGPATGSVVAVDPATGKVRWRASLPKPAVGGTLTTGGGLVFAGDDDGDLYTFSAGDGTQLSRRRLGFRFGSAPIAYETNGTEYIAIVDGGSQAAADGTPGGGELFVFRLG